MTTRFKINWDWKKEREEYEELCPQCNGKGIKDCWYPIGGFIRKGLEPSTCEVCKGRGKIDWIDKIKKENF